MKTSEPLPPLWRCPKCGAQFVSANMSHSCGRFRLEDLFAGRDPQAFSLFEKFKRMVEACGPVVMIPQKTRLVFMVRMRFAAVYPRKSSLRVGLVLSRRLAPSRRIDKVIEYAPQCIGHELTITSAGDLDATIQRWLRAAYDVGTQKGFVRRGHAARRRPLR